MVAENATGAPAAGRLGRRLPAGARAGRGTKHEFAAGEIYAMAGGSLRHSALASRISAALENGRPSNCVAFQSDMRLRVLASGRGEPIPMPPWSVGPIELDPADPTGMTITNPTLLVEVLSPSTDDAGDKWRDYQRIPSLQEYVLVGQEPRIEIYRRMPSRTWEYVEVSEGTAKPWIRDRRGAPYGDAPGRRRTL